MNNNSTYYIELITRYFSGEIAEDKLRVLSDWLKADPAHEESFRQYLETWQLIEKQNVNSKLDIDKEWITLKAKMNSPVSANETQVRVVPMSATNNQKLFALKNIWKAAAVVTILLVSSFLLYYYISKPAIVVVTADAGNIEQILPDGSVVSLHASSEIIYPSTFGSGIRNVELKGEAYFKVTHDKTKPFIVASGDARIEVLGTQFNVNTKSSSGSMEVVLTTGKVSVYYKEKPAENVLLAPGEKAVLVSGEKLITKSTNTDANYMAWKTRILVFDSETLAQVVNTLQNVYQATITLADPKLSVCRVTASFNDQSLESVLQVLKETLDLQVKQKGNTIEISGEGCN
jgi:transmembrane sensor